jgi:TonB-dependent SusC/RagA subfamily outer membrane receptor
MKENRPIQAWLVTMIRITFCQIFLVAIFAGVSYAYDGKNQDLLNEKISLQVQDQKISKVLKQIEKLADVKFVFSSSLIGADRAVSMDVKDETLNEVLNYLLLPLQLRYEVSGKTIIVHRNKLGEIQQIIPNLNLQAVPVLGISGKVTDDTGQGLPGVNVLLKETTTGTTTDGEGNYALNAPDGNGTLVFSFIGYTTEEVPINNRTTINISMVPDVKSLSEVVVVGYGTQRKTDVTGALTSISTKEFETQPVTRVDQILQGRAAGVQVTNASGAPGGGVRIRVRGANSILGDNNPLYVVDGYVGADFTTINPNDIESIQVLKDASSTAIYGSRGANGVVIITTKKGAKGGVKVSYNAQLSTSEVIGRYSTLPAGEFAEYLHRPRLMNTKGPVVQTGRMKYLEMGWGRNINWEFLVEMKKQLFLSLLTTWIRMV